VDELLYALLISVSAVIIKLLMQCSVFSNVGRFASEKVVLDLIRNKCLPVLLYGEEACPMLVRDKRSLELTVTRPLMKLFQAGYATVVGDCMHFFLLLASASQSSNRYSYGKIFGKISRVAKTTGWPKKVSHCQIIKKIVLNRIKVCQCDYISSSNDQAL